MFNMVQLRSWVAAVILVCLSTARPAWACAVCFGDPNSDMVKGANAGIIVMLVIVYTLLLGMAGIAGFWAFKARRISKDTNTPSGHQTASGKE